MDLAKLITRSLFLGFDLAVTVGNVKNRVIDCGWDTSGSSPTPRHQRQGEHQRAQKNAGFARTAHVQAWPQLQLNLLQVHYLSLPRLSPHIHWSLTDAHLASAPV
jgi:hypothetical protein